MAEARKQLDRRWLWLGAGILLIVVFFLVRELTRQRLPVRIATVTRDSLASTISTNGRVEPEANYEIHSPLSTTVKAVYVHPGDQVPAGKVLLELDNVEALARVASAESAVKSAQAALDTVLNNGTPEQRQMAAAELTQNRLNRDQAQRDSDALTKLNSSGAASASEVAAARQRLAGAEAALTASEQNAHSRYSSADVARTRAALADAEASLTAARSVATQTTVRAPISGTVYNLNTAATEFAQEGKLLLEIADLSRDRVRAYFDEPDIGRLSVGQQILIKWDAKPELVWHGHIQRTPVSVMTYGTRNVGEVMVAIDGGNGTLLPDTNVTVTVTTSSQSDVLNIPRESLFSQSGKPYVFKLVDDQLQKTPVVTGALNLTQVAILSGLAEGDKVATGTSSGEPLQAGMPIKVVQ